MSAVVAPASPETSEQPQGNGGGIPFMLTAAHKAKLHALGYSNEQILHMTPREGHDIIAQRRELAGVAFSESRSGSRPCPRGRARTSCSTTVCPTLRSTTWRTYEAVTKR
jgi:hypothetical protein